MISIITNCLPLIVWSYFIIFWSHFSCRTFLCKINNNLQLWKFGLSTVFPKQGVTLFMSHFSEQNFCQYIVMKVWSVKWTQWVTLSVSHFFEQNFYFYLVVEVSSVNRTIPVFPKQGVTLFMSHFSEQNFY